MRQVRIRVTCDACQAWHGAEVEDGVETVPVSAGQTLDLCPSHRTDLAPLLALIAEWGAAPSSNGGSRASKATAAATSAPAAPAEPARAPNRRGGARARARRASSAQGAPAPTTEAGPAPCPLCQQSMANSDSLSSHLRHVHDTNVGQVYGTTCPLCGHDGVRGRHLSSHGITGGMPQAFLMAQQQGDPHGVLAARATALAR